MITIKNYDPHHPLSNYQLGDTYIFRIHNPNSKRLIKVKENDFKTYIEILTDTIETHKELIKNNAQYLNFTESIGVVVDKHKSTTSSENDYITVVFKTSTNEFVINKYVVDYHHRLSSKDYGGNVFISLSPLKRKDQLIKGDPIYRSIR